METFIIRVPNTKSALVKQILTELGVSIKTEPKDSKKKSAHDFLGLISTNDVVLMEKAIEEGCEQVD